MGGGGQAGGEQFKGLSAFENRACTLSSSVNGEGSSVSNPLLFLQFADRLKEGGLENFISGVKNFPPVDELLSVTRLTEALMESARFEPVSSRDGRTSVLRSQGRSKVDAPGASGGSAGDTSRGSKMAYLEGSSSSLVGRSMVIWRGG